MRSIVLLYSIIALLCVSHVALGQTQYDTYSNARFSYSIDYPAKLMIKQIEADNGDGRIFRAKKGTAEIRVWGQYNALFYTLKKAYSADLKERGSGVSYKLLKRGSYVISGIKDGRLYYQKTILSGKDGDSSAVFATFMLEYDPGEKSTYDAVAARLSRSFKFQ